MIRRVVITRNAQKQLLRLPTRIGVKLMAWVAAVESRGLEEVRNVPGYHDEPLLGKRSGQRSIRLSIGYRAVYRIRADDVEFVSVEEVTKHDY